MKIVTQAILFVALAIASAPLVAQYAVSVEPAALAFPRTPVGSSSAPLTVVVANTDAVARTITVEANGILCVPTPEPCLAPPGWYTDFRFQTDCSQAPLPPGSTCTLQVFFEPTGTGQRTSSLIVFPGVFPAVTVSLEGVGGDTAAALAHAIPALGPWQLPVLAGALALLGWIRLHGVR